MARYAIGDIQGCYSQFIQLVKKINFNPSVDMLYLVGDLVNRGPESLKVLKWIYRHQDSLVTVLGNHDVFLLGRYAGVIKPDSDETIGDILTAPEAPKLIDWLRRCPIVFHDSDYILAHAGIHPKMDFNKLMTLNNSITQHLQSDSYGAFIATIYGNKPNLWTEKLNHTKQMKFVINSCTRMRLLSTLDFSLDYKFKGELSNNPKNLIPWFKADFHPSIQKKIVFGHWAALGFYHDPKFIALDTGCVWGRKLTAINLDTYEITQVSA